MNILLVQLAIVFLPGLIWAQLDVRYAQKAKPSQAEFLIRSFYIRSYDIRGSLYRLCVSGKRVFDSVD